MNSRFSIVKYTIMFCMSIIPFLIFAQKDKIPGTAHNLNTNVPVFQLPSLNNDSLRQLEANLNPDGPRRISQLIEVDVDFKNEATRDSVSGGNRVYRMKLNSPNATGLTLLFDEFYIAHGAELYIYDADTTVIFGPFTNSFGSNGTFSIPPLWGGAAIIELLEPYFPTVASAIHLFRVGHVYEESGQSEGESSDCNNNVNCPIGAGWENQKRAVVRLDIYEPNSAGYWGSGTMINNTAQDGKLYLLTAFHNIDVIRDCVIDEVEMGWLAFLTVTFNYEAEDCSGTSGNETQFVSGAVLLTSNLGTDFALLELTMAPLAAYNVYLAGWNKSETTPSMGVGIHHPQGDIKKISVEHDPPLSDSWQGATCPNSNPSYWKVKWNNNASEHNGITEGGSSGSPFFNQDGLIVGQLRGGDINIRDTNGVMVPCSIPTNHSWYGKLSSSWLFGSPPLHTFLDPVHGIATLTGVNLNDVVLPNPYDPSCTGDYVIACQWGELNCEGGRYCHFFNEDATLSDIQWDDVHKRRRARKTLSADNIEISGGSNIRFEAMKKISLKAPFKSQNSTFVAQLGPCYCDCPIGPLYPDELLCDYSSESGKMDESDASDQNSPPKIVDISTPTLFPNPTTGLVTLKAPEAVGTVQVLELTGRVLQTLAANGSTNVSIDLSPYHPGTFLLRAVYVSGKTEVWRVVRQ